MCLRVVAKSGRKKGEGGADSEPRFGIVLLIAKAALEREHAGLRSLPPDERQAALRALRRRVHPDKHPSDTDRATELFQHLEGLAL